VDIISGAQFKNIKLEGHSKQLVGRGKTCNFVGIKVNFAYQEGCFFKVS